MEIAVSEEGAISMVNSITSEEQLTKLANTAGRHGSTGVLFFLHRGESWLEDKQKN